MFDGQTDAAVKFYTTVFKDSRIVESSPGPEGRIMSAVFELNGQEFMAFDGGPHFTFAQGLSLFVKCETQDEIDHFYEKLSEGGAKQPCGWLKDRFGVSWQIIPPILGAYLRDPDREKAGRVMQAMLKMQKINIAELEAAYNG
jgi:predicted 3-demethylubiquinone-9 3-methyltransferase (glyoxalase superfamily)